MGEAIEGTVIHGTMRDEDVIPAFTAELERLNFDAAVEIHKSHKVEYISLAAGVEIQPRIYAMFLVEALMDALDREAPEGMYFGAHPGDGSDFGFWPVEMLEA